jgi:hypothetical protein
MDRLERLFEEGTRHGAVVLLAALGGALLTWLAG